MALQLDANVNILWQNLIALNASLNHENQERREELLQTKKLLEGVRIYKITCICRWEQG